MRLLSSLVLSSALLHWPVTVAVTRDEGMAKQWRAAAIGPEFEMTSFAGRLAAILEIPFGKDLK